jgi:hypothetical protein
MSVKVNSRLSFTTAMAAPFMRSRSQFGGATGMTTSRVFAALLASAVTVMALPDRRVRGMLRLLHTTALSHLLSAPGRSSAVARGSGNSDGGARRRDRPPHTRSIPHRHGAADHHGRPGKRPVPADCASIRHPPARRNGRAGPRILRRRAPALRVVRVPTGPAFSSAIE